MDLLRNTYDQFAGVVGSLAPSQRLTLLAVPVLILGAFGYLLTGRGDTSLVPISLGKEMTTEELINAEAALAERGMTDFRREGRQLLVPADEVERYNAALLAGGGLPTHWAAEWAEQFEKSSIFTSRDQLTTMQEIALANQLRRMIRAIPGIADGTVVWARSKERSRFSRRTDSVSATITVKPRPGHEVSGELGQSLRFAVANMVPDLTPERVVVFSTSGRVVTPTDEDDPLNGRFLKRVREFTEMYRQKVEAALSYIPDVLVTVNVDLDNVKRTRINEVTYDTKNAVDVVLNESTRNRSSNSTGPAAEPGAVPNRPRALDASDGPKQSESDSQTESSAIRAPSYVHQERELVAAIPKAVQVSIGVPEDYFADALAEKGVEKGADDADAGAYEKELAAFRETVRADVSSTVAKAIGAADQNVNVTSYVRVADEEPLPSEPLFDRVGRWIGQWGGTILLALFAAWALRAVVRAAPGASTADEREDDDPDPDLEQLLSAGPTMPTVEAMPDPEPTARDELQSVVRDNPEMAAAVIGKWIRASQA